MKAKSLIFCTTLATCSALLSSCNEDGIASLVGQPVQFTTSAGPSSRTVYGTGSGDDPWNIYWQAGDEINIYAYGFTPEKATYVLKESNTKESKVNPKDADNLLRWPDDAAHNIYAMYPADEDKIKTEYDEDGYETQSFKMILNQSGDLDMTNVYLLGGSGWVKSSDFSEGSVLLKVEPQCCVFDMTLQGFINNASEHRTIESVTFKTKVTHDGDYVKFNNVGATLGTETDVTYTWTPSSTLTLNGSANATPNTANFAIAMMLTKAIGRESGGTAYSMTITVNCSGGKKYVATLQELPGDIVIPRNAKVKLVLPPFQENTPLDPNTFTLNLGGSALQHTVSNSFHETGIESTDNFDTNGWEE